MATPPKPCDFSPMMTTIKEDIQAVIGKLGQVLRTLDDERDCLLCELENIKKSFLQIESGAATFYLNCYLSPFIDRHEDVSLTIQNLSDRRHGALIAVERSEPLGPFLQPGIPVGAPVTHSLLESIFYPGNPLHDGAVWIRANQIVSAKNVLPLSSVQGYDRITGTRHRAAVGLSERCDAIVLVVSEETGKASFASKGLLYPVITP